MTDDTDLSDRDLVDQLARKRQAWEDGKGKGPYTGKALVDAYVSFFRRHDERIIALARRGADMAPPAIDAEEMPLSDYVAHADGLQLADDDDSSVR